MPAPAVLLDTSRTSPAVDLRERLILMRDSLVEGLAGSEYLDTGRLTLLGQVGAAISALDAGEGG